MEKEVKSPKTPPQAAGNKKPLSHHTDSGYFSPAVCAFLIVNPLKSSQKCEIMLCTICRRRSQNGQYMTLDKVESICVAMDCTPNDILDFVPDNTEEE